MRTIDRLVLEERFCDEFEPAVVLGEQFPSPIFLACQNRSDFLVEHSGGLVRIFTAVRHEIFTKEDLLLT